MSIIESGGVETKLLELLNYGPEARKAALGNIVSESPTLGAELESLLAVDAEAQGFLSLSPVQPIADFEEQKAIPIRQSIGAYRIIREIGRGGMGTVFFAERADGEYHQKVAIKLVNGVLDDESTRRRFKTERQILANFQHPYIARLLDGGTTEDGCPYLVMECIHGEPINVYCSTRKLSIKDKLELFLKVCAAVDYAH